MVPHVLIRSLTYISPGITPDEIEQLLPLLTIKCYSKNEHIVLPGQESRQFNFIEKGSARMYNRDKEGIERNILLGIEGSFIQDYESLVLNRPSSFYVQVLENSEVVHIDFEQYSQLMNTSLNWATCGRMTNQFILMGVMKRMRSFLMLTPEQIYMNILREEPYLLERFSLEHIASYIGIKRESLSRIRKRLSVEHRI